MAGAPGRGRHDPAEVGTLEDRVDDLAWDDLGDQLDSRGFALTEPLLDDRETQQLTALFDGGRFRSTIDMARHRFGDGRYRYFDHPLPDAIADLRRAFYRRLAPVALGDHLPRRPLSGRRDPGRGARDAGGAIPPGVDAQGPPALPKGTRPSCPRAGAIW